jgi:hypothetical protein
VAKNQSEIVAKSLERVKAKIQEELALLGIDYTGELSDSLTVKETAFGAILTALDYLPTSFDNVGRGPGGNPWIDPDWLRAKGIQPRNLKTGRFISYKSAAILISRKIGREGTDRYMGERPGIDIEGILFDEAPKLKNKLAASFVAKFREDLKQTTISQ